MSNLITLTDPTSAAAEAFRSLRTNLQFSDLDNPLKTLLITAPTADADSANKSETIANMAVTFAQGEYNTLLIDADLRRPAQHALFGLDNNKGLTTALLDGEDAVRSGGIENLSVLTAGPTPSNPADVLGSKKMGALLADLKTQYDMILVDAPPLLAVTDSSVLASKLDGVALVITAGKTRRDHAEDAKKLLQKINIPLVGVVLNNAPKDTSVGNY